MTKHPPPGFRGLTPDPGLVPANAGCIYDKVVTQMTRPMSLGDAVMAVPIAKCASIPGHDCVECQALSG